MRHIIINFFLMTILCLSVTSCSSKSKTIRTESEDTMYNKALQQIEASDYNAAVDTLESLEIEYPATNLLPDVLMYKAFANYSDGKHFESILVIDEFLKQFPNHPKADYMLYMRGMNYYSQIVDAGRDQQLTELAKSNFEKFLSIYPHSSYSLKAKFKVDYLNALLAEKEMKIGYFYLQNHQYIAAMNRFKTVIEDYETTLFAPEALYRLAEICLKLGLNEQAQIYTAVLGKNFPASVWYKKLHSIMNNQ